MLPEKRALGDGWAGNDAVELAFMASDGATADIIVFRGFTSGNFEAFKLVNKKRVEAAELKKATLKTNVKGASSKTPRSRLARISHLNPKTA